MRIFIFFSFLLLSITLEAQKNDLLILDGVKYKGKLLNYSKSDIRSSESGKISFFIYRLDDTLNISSDRNIKLKINKYPEFYEFTKKSWNSIELGINTGNFSSNTGAYISKGLINDKLFNPGFGSGIFMIDMINFVPIYIKNFYDIYPLNRQTTFKLFAENKIGYSFGEDFGMEDYISTNGGFFWNPSIGIKKSSGKKHISLKLGYLLQGYSSEHNNWWWWDMIDIFIPGQNISDDIIRRDGYFKRMTISFSVFF
tara:strand:+ start:528 stop:1292 length:765 start_codon:yes stop_codon:yes gene_type:complete